MAGIKVGRDRLGRRFKTVNGKRVAVGDDEQHHKVKPQSPYGVRDPINTLFRKWLKGARTPEQVKKNISQLLASKFRLWFDVQGKTSIGKYGRLYAARHILQALTSGSHSENGKLTADDVRKLRDMSTRGALNTDKFYDELRRRGVHVPPAPAGDPGDEDDGYDTVTGPPPNEDQRILSIVHFFRLSADQLQAVLSKALQSNTPPETSKT